MMITLHADDGGNALPDDMETLLKELQDEVLVQVTSPILMVIV